MPAISELNNLADLLKYEAPNLYSREQAIVSAQQHLALGTVVGRVLSTLKLKALDPNATDGSEIAIGVLANDVDAQLADREDALFIARHAILARHAIIWPAAITDVQINLAISQLSDRGILIRDSA